MAGALGLRADARAARRCGCGRCWRRGSTAASPGSHAAPRSPRPRCCSSDSPATARCSARSCAWARCSASPRSTTRATLAPGRRGARRADSASTASSVALAAPTSAASRSPPCSAATWSGRGSALDLPLWRELLREAWPIGANILVRRVGLRIGAAAGDAASRAGRGRLPHLGVAPHRRAEPARRRGDAQRLPAVRALRGGPSGRAARARRADGEAARRDPARRRAGGRRRPRRRSWACCSAPSSRSRVRRSRCCRGRRCWRCWATSTRTCWSRRDGRRCCSASTGRACCCSWRCSSR